MSYGDYRRVGGCDIPKTHNYNTVLVSGAEDPELVESFKSSGWEVKPARGCGHKLLKVALGMYKYNPSYTDVWIHADLCKIFICNIGII